MGRHIYVHIPFCEAKCPYCSFFSVADKDHYGEYFDALKKEIESAPLNSADDHEEIDTVYFGGGTPSVPDSDHIKGALNAVLDHFNIDPGNAEITIEANPHSLTADKAGAYIAMGFNRISMGIQSLHDDTLKLLGRLHNREGALGALKIAREAGFENISGDLIIGVPGQTTEEVIEDAQTLIDCGCRHISSYSLSIEEGTPFERRYGKSLDDPDIQEVERAMYHGLRDFLNRNGFVPYEISNSSLKGYESRHNSAYWRAVEYYGFGAGSHGYIGGQRYGHECDIRKYIKAPDQTIVEEVLTESDKMTEYAMLMLRTSSGLTDEGFIKRFGRTIPEDIRKIMKILVDRKLCDSIDSGIRLSRYGLDYANEAFMEFL